MNTVITKSYSLPKTDRAEVMRYAFSKNSTKEIDALLDECLADLPELSCAVCFTEIDTLRLGSPSLSLNKHLGGCDSVIVFAATLGIAIDRLIARYSKLSPAKALMLQAIGAERIEALCDKFEDDLTESGYVLCPRFSPGYGDLGLEFQKNIFAVLDCAKHIGVSISDSFVMSPSKSVTGIIGIKKRIERTDQ